MKDEIKIVTLGDIFENLQSREKAMKLLCYIKHLQEENKRLKNYMNSLGEYKFLEKKNRVEKEYYENAFKYVSKDALNYKSRIDKAIEKIKKIQYNANKYGADHDVIVCQNLLNILQESDKDVK